MPVMAWRRAVVTSSSSSVAPKKLQSIRYLHGYAEPENSTLGARIWNEVLYST
jgi:hypothetical protein